MKSNSVLRTFLRVMLVLNFALLPNTSEFKSIEIHVFSSFSHIILMKIIKTYCSLFTIICYHSNSKQFNCFFFLSSMYICARRVFRLFKLEQKGNYYVTEQSSTLLKFQPGNVVLFALAVRFFLTKQIS